MVHETRPFEFLDSPEWAASEPDEVSNYGVRYFIKSVSTKYILYLQSVTQSKQEPIFYDALGIHVKHPYTSLKLSPHLPEISGFFLSRFNKI